MYVDAHTHLDHYSADEIEEGLAQIAHMPCKTWAVSMDLESWETTQRLAKGEPNILPTFGIHPWNAHTYAHRLDELDQPTAESDHVGEIGLDFYWVKEKERWPKQEVVLDYFLKRAAEQNKIVNLHTKGAEELILAKLQQHKVHRAIIHWYSGDIATFDALASYGCYFTFGVELQSNELIQACAKRCPADRLLTETDGPGGLEWLTGERAFPKHISTVVDLMGALRGRPSVEIRQVLFENFLALTDD